MFQAIHLRFRLAIAPSVVQRRTNRLIILLQPQCKAPQFAYLALFCLAEPRIQSLPCSPPHEIEKGLRERIRRCHFWRGPAHRLKRAAFIGIEVVRLPHEQPHRLPGRQPPLSLVGWGWPNLLRHLGNGPAPRKEPDALVAALEPQGLEFVPQQGRLIAALCPPLLDHSLVRLEESATGEARFRRIETIRVYAVEQFAASGEQALLQNRHAAYFLKLAEQAEPSLESPQAVEWLDRLEAELDNIRAALEHGPADIALRLAGAIWMFWDLRNHEAEGMRWLDHTRERATLEASGDSTPSSKWRAGLAKSLFASGMLAMSRADDRMHHFLLQSLTLYRELDDRRGLARVLVQCAHLLEDDRGRHTEMTSLLEEALVLARGEDDQGIVAWALNMQARGAILHGDHAAARAPADESMRLRRELGDQYAIAWSLIDMAWLAEGENDIAAARAAFTERLEIERELGHMMGVADGLASTGHMARHAGRFEEARRLLGEALAIARHAGQRYRTLDYLLGLGRTLLDDRAYVEVQAVLEEALDLARAAGEDWAAQIALALLTYAARRRDELDQAQRWLDAGLALGPQLDPGSNVELMRERAMLALARGEFVQAEEHGAAVLALARSLNNRWFVGGSLRDLGLVALITGDDRCGEERYRESLRLFPTIDPWGVVRSLLGLAVATGRQGHLVRTARLLELSTRVLTPLERSPSGTRRNISICSR